MCLQKEEEFFACKWSVEERSGAPLLLIAGKKGLLKVLNCVTESLQWVRLCDQPGSPPRARCAMQERGGHCRCSCMRCCLQDVCRSGPAVSVQGIGVSGIVKLYQCGCRHLQVAEGHGDAINDIAVHPSRPSLVLTASRVNSFFLLCNNPQ